MTIRNCLGVVALATFLPLASVAATIDVADFSGSETTIDFEGLTAGTGLTNQFAGLGLTFGSFAQVDPFPNSTIQGNIEGTNFSSGANVVNPLVLNFSSTQNLFGALLGSDSTGVGEFSISAFLNGVLQVTETFTVDSFLPGGTLISGFAGLNVSGGFNSVEVSRTDSEFFSYDDVRFEAVAPVPLPAGGLLLLSGIGGVAALKRRKKRAA